MNLTGHTVWVSLKETADASKHSSYYDGEYFVLRETPNGIVCAKLDGGYGGHQTQSFSRRLYDIADDGINVAHVNDWLEELEYFASALKRGEELRWVQSVYTGAASVARQARKALTKADAASAVRLLQEPDQVDLDALAAAVAARLSVSLGVTVSR